MYTNIYVYMYICIYVCMYICIYLRIYICVCVQEREKIHYEWCISIYICVCVRTYTRVHVGVGAACTWRTRCSMYINTTGYL